MEEAVGRLFTPEIRNAAARAFGADPERLEELGDFENYVYRFARGEREYILRIAHSSHRSAEQIEAELDWVAHLVEHEVRMARPVCATSGARTVTLGDGNRAFHACAFERVPGRHPTRNDWTPALFEEWGRLLGRTHRLSGSYRPPPGAAKRLRWDEDPFLIHGRSWIPEDQAAVRRRWDQILAELANLPERRESFGLCHTDLHQGNFHVHEGRIYAFDTDDCSYHWFIEDLSTVLFYALRHEASEDDPTSFASWAWPAVWSGYASEFALDPCWLDRLPLFHRARRIALYALVHMKCDPDDEIRLEIEERYRPAIEADSPVYDVDLRELVCGPQR